MTVIGRPLITFCSAALCIFSVFAFANGTFSIHDAASFIIGLVGFCFTYTPWFDGIKFNFYRADANKVIKFLNECKKWKVDEPRNCEQLLNKMKSDFGRKFVARREEKAERVFQKRLEEAAKHMDFFLARMKKIRPQSSDIGEI